MFTINFNYDTEALIIVNTNQIINLKFGRLGNKTKGSSIGTKQIHGMAGV